MSHRVLDTIETFTFQKEKLFKMIQLKSSGLELMALLGSIPVLIRLPRNSGYTQTETVTFPSLQRGS